MYSDKEKTEIFDVICEKIVNGQSLRSILNEIGSISPSTFFIWLREDESKSKQYARCTEERSELIFEDMFDIADDSRNDYITRISNDGVEYEVLNSEHIQRSKLRIDTRKWALSKMNPKKYGDKLDLTSAGEKIEGTQIINSPFANMLKDEEDGEAKESV